VQGLKPNSVATLRIPIQSFFSAHRVALKFRRGELDVEELAVDKVIKEWIPDNQQMKQIYFILQDKLNQNLEGTMFLKQYADLRDNEHYEWSNWAIFK
jgi:hypothetical protein